MTLPASATSIGKKSIRMRAPAHRWAAPGSEAGALLSTHGLVAHAATNKARRDYVLAVWDWAKGG
eukprot:scaffold117674_cov72-Phaeocystis_antarctica.AAC.1